MDSVQELKLSGVLSLAFRLLLIFGSFFFILCCSRHCLWRWTRRQLALLRTGQEGSPGESQLLLSAQLLFIVCLSPGAGDSLLLAGSAGGISWPGISGFVSGPHHPEHSRVCGPFRTGHKPGQLHRASSSVHDIDPALLSVLPGKGGGTELGIQRGNWGSTKMLLQSKPPSRPCCLHLGASPCCWKERPTSLLRPVTQTGFTPHHFHLP